MKKSINSSDYIIDKDGMSFMKLRDAFNESFVQFKTLGVSDKYGVQLQGMLDFGLTKEEALHILAYTSFSAKWINESIINDEYSLNENCKLFIINLDNALRKIPPIKTNFLYRMDLTSDKDQIYKHFKARLKQKMHIKHYLSTDKEEYPQAEITWIIKPLAIGSNGRDISNITNNGAEREVLFMRNTNFLVNNISKKENKIHIHLKEIEN